MLNEIPFHQSLSHMLRYLIVLPLAYITGVGVYVSALWIIWGQSVGADMPAVLFWSLLAFLVAFLFVYLPILTAIRIMLGGYRPVLVFAVAASLIGVVPTAIILFSWGGGIRDLFSAEASLFLIMFVCVGIVIGIGFAWPRTDRDTGRCT